MAIERYSIRIARLDQREDAVFEFDDARPGHLRALTLHCFGREFVGDSRDYFESMCLIRNELEEIGWRPVCYGASLNVYPSGMCRDMGRGLKAYRVHPGCHARMTDLVSIFDTGPDVNPASVVDQRKFWNDWLLSVRQTKP
jgi:hypothetical protein